MNNISKKQFIPVRRSVNSAPVYEISWASEAPLLSADWDDSTWSTARTVKIDHFHPASSSHRPQTEARVLYDNDGLYVSFRSHDQYVRCVHTTYQSRVSQDSCVEFFVQPQSNRGYFNFEVNCGGTMLLFYIEDPTRVDGALFRKYQEVSPDIARDVRMYHSLPQNIPAEIQEPTEWRVSWFIPFSMMERFVGPIAKPPLGQWRGNFFKCGDETSHPHWASWAPIGEQLRFHQPDCFGNLEFSRAKSPLNREHLSRG